MIPRSIDRVLSAFPGAIGAHYCGYKAYRWGEPYLRLVSLLADRSRLSVDIGAHEGDYTYFMRRYSAGCIAYECNPRLARLLRRRFGRSVDIRSDAVSDHAGFAELRIPRSSAGENPGRATIEKGNPLAGDFVEIERVRVPTVRLDDVIHRPVGLIKIDVEGHEMAVLRGAEGILERDRPNLIVELEDRHVPGIVAKAFGHLARFGYQPTCLQDGRLIPAPADHAARLGLWNYVFTHPSDPSKPPSPPAGSLSRR